MGLCQSAEGSPRRGSEDESAGLVGAGAAGLRMERGAAFTDAQRAAYRRPPGARMVAPGDYGFLAECMEKVLIFGPLDASRRKGILGKMWEKEVEAGQILIREGGTGRDAEEMYVVKSGYLEVTVTVNGTRLRVNRKERGDVFGEVALLFDLPRNATVTATSDCVVWVLDRTTCRSAVKESAEDQEMQNLAFLNSVPILAPLDPMERQILASAVESVKFAPGEEVFREGQEGDVFYMIKEGEATVTQLSKEDATPLIVNQLFSSDFFGEKALFDNASRNATVTAKPDKGCTCLCLSRDKFVQILGPLQDLIEREKMPEVIEERMRVLQKRRVPGADATCPIHLYKVTGGAWQLFSVCEGKTAQVAGLKEVEFLQKLNEIRSMVNEGGEAKRGAAQEEAKSVERSSASKRRMSSRLSISESFAHMMENRPGEGGLGGEGGQDKNLQLKIVRHIGGGAFSRVWLAEEPKSGRQFALKVMRKVAMIGCKEHVFCEQMITENCAHPMAIRQYASFKDENYLYMLFDLMPGGDLMDILVANSSVSEYYVQTRSRKKEKRNVLVGLEEDALRYYGASLVLVFEYLHSKGIVYRDLKPENVLLDKKGLVKLGDFGFAKNLGHAHGKTYTFCGTPGYVAPENVLASGYGTSVDWWGLGVLLYVMRTGRQPFNYPKTDDPVVVMKRIVDPKWDVGFPPYVSAEMKDLILNFLQRDPNDRLGHGPLGVRNIKDHPFFHGFDWEMLSCGRAEPPIGLKPPPRRPEGEEEDLLEASFSNETAEEKFEANSAFEDF